jgi:hypothetical protein
MISLSSGFQSSVNIAYDLNDDTKLNNYIPTNPALNLLEEVLLSTRKDSTDRARILIGAYGKGKSHIVLMILSVLLKKDLSLFKKMMPIVEAERPQLYQLIKNYYQSNEKFLPVIVMGGSNSLSQAFSLALQRTLSENELTDLMPETNYQAAVKTLNKWKANFPETYSKFEESIRTPLPEFIDRLNRFDPVAYEEFEALYPELTSGSKFNPFVGFDVVELYEKVLSALKERGYTGIYVVFDEFNKYLENHIKYASKNDTIILQSFAEKCSRSGSDQLHLMLISHKDITSYIDSAARETVDGWRGVSERVRHIYLNENSTQTYKIIEQTIEKDEEQWSAFREKYQSQFDTLINQYKNHPLFSELTDAELRDVVYKGYPLHPVTTYILPRISELVAQNERTLFTFLSSSGQFTLSDFLQKHSEETFELVTPDQVYDYFDPLMKQEVYAGELHKMHGLATTILRDIDPDSIDAKIVKTIALIYILQHFEKLKPTVDELNGIYITAGTEAVRNAVDRLIKDERSLYLQHSNQYLKLKQRADVNIAQTIVEMMQKQANTFDVKKTLGEVIFDNYMYPSRYNDEKDMTRYFEVRFIKSKEITDDINWQVKRENIDADGVIFAILPEIDEKDELLIEKLERTSAECRDCLFVLPKYYINIEMYAREYTAVDALMNAATDDKVLYEDYELIRDDMQESIKKFLTAYTRPERNQALYVYKGELINIYRRSDLTEQLSKICDDIYGDTPVINNEVINKKNPTSIACNSRSKIVAGLLRAELEPNLGLSGTGQEISIMRSTLINTGVLQQNGNSCTINLQPQDPALRKVLHLIQDFLLSSVDAPAECKDLYDEICGVKEHIAMRKGLVPIYLAAVMHMYRKQIILYQKMAGRDPEQVALTAANLDLINNRPEEYSVRCIAWDNHKEQYLKDLSQLFHIEGDEDAVLNYENIAFAINRWYMALPKYTRELKYRADGSAIPEDCAQFFRMMRKKNGSYELVFTVLPETFAEGRTDEETAAKFADTKNYLDSAVDELKNYLVAQMKVMFCTTNTNICEQMSLSSVIHDWCEQLDPAVFEQIFDAETTQFLKLCQGITNDEHLFIDNLAQPMTGLHIEDWNDNTKKAFLDDVQKCQNIAQEYHREENATEQTGSSREYVVTFTDDAGMSVTKRFNRVQESSRSKLLYNAIRDQIDSMGESISEEEKRQILMDVLKEMC